MIYILMLYVDYHIFKTNMPLIIPLLNVIKLNYLLLLYNIGKQ